MTHVIVVIPFHNEVNYIEKVICCLKNQRLPTFFRWKIIFVDNQSTDATITIINNEMKESGIDYSILREDRLGTVYSRPTGLLNAANHHPEVIISLDADVDFDDSLIYSTWEEVRKSSLRSVFIGKIKYSLELRLALMVSSPNIFNAIKLFRECEQKLFGRHLFGAFFAISADSYFGLGEIDPEKHEYFFGEDIFYARRSYYAGYTFRQLSSFVHPHPRRYIKDGNKSYEHMIGNDRQSHQACYKNIRFESFSKLSEYEEKEVLTRLTENYSHRMIWSIIDAHMYWKRSGMRSIRALQSVVDACKFFSLDLSSFDACASQDVKVVYEHLNSRSSGIVRDKLNLMLIL